MFCENVIIFGGKREKHFQKDSTQGKPLNIADNEAIFQYVFITFFCSQL